MEQNPPANTYVSLFTPSTIKHDFLLQSWKDQVKFSHTGAKELRGYALEKYGELPFIIELHDTPFYATFWGEHDEKYSLSYPLFNKKLGAILKEFKQTLPDKKMSIVYHEMKRSPAYHSLIVESWPVQYREGGMFETLKVEDEEKMVRKVVDFLQKNRGTS